MEAYRSQKDRTFFLEEGRVYAYLQAGRRMTQRCQSRGVKAVVIKTWHLLVYPVRNNAPFFRLCLFSMIPQGEEDLDITIFKVFLAEQGEKGFRTHVSRCVWNYDEDISTGQPFLQGFFTGRKGKGCGE